MSDDTRPVTSILQPLSTDEYEAPPRTNAQALAVDTAAGTGADAADRVKVTPARYTESGGVPQLACLR